MAFRIYIGLLLLAISFAAIGGTILQVRPIVRMPQALSNNAVAAQGHGNSLRLYSFNGLGSMRSVASISNHSWLFEPGSQRAVALPDVPYGGGVLASIAVNVKGQIYLFGGYSVAADHSEKSHPNVYRFDTADESWFDTGTMPIAVDDSVALVYQERYIYLISGWHDIGNVSTVQVLDTQTGSWQFATPFPGRPTFGHGGAIANNRLLVTGGVEVSGVREGKRQFAMAKQAYLGEIDASDHTRIIWRKLQLPEHNYRYRPGMAYWRQAGCWLLLGGSRVAYNYNGVGYNGQPAEPESRVACINKNGNSVELGMLARPVMDLRGLVIDKNMVYWVGGMGPGQRVMNQVFKLDLEPLLSSIAEQNGKQAGESEKH